MAELAQEGVQPVAGLEQASGAQRLLFGGTAEYVALWFKNEGMESGFYVYVSVVMGVALLISIFMRDTSRHSLIRED